MIEDNPTNLQLMVYLLTAFGHDPVEAHDGVEGIEKARREKPDLILLDIHMPRMDGYEVARVLRTDPECSQIPLIAVTALAMVGDREKILASGFSGYIAKPLDPETFPTQVQGYLGAGFVPGARRVPQELKQTYSPTSTPHEKLAVVLIVDDLQTNIELARCILEPGGYKVISASSPKEGFDLAQVDTPDIIVSDIHMSPEDGYAFLRMIQADPKLSRVPFIFLSSSVAGESEKQRALSRGAKKFIPRPIDPQALLSEVARSLNRETGD